jgi:hypothetical protein
MDIKWFKEVPPAFHANRETQMKQFVEELKARPGEWALYPKVYKNGASANSFKKRYVGTQWKTRKSTREEGFDLYATWAPDENPTSDPTVPNS